jgi:hypothetical protein
VSEAASGDPLARDHGGSFARSSAPPLLSLPRQELLWKLQLRFLKIHKQKLLWKLQNSETHKQKLLWKLQLRLTSKKYLVLKEVVPGHATEAFCTGEQYASATRSLVFPCIGDAKRYRAVAFWHGDDIPGVPPPTQGPNHHRPPASPRKSGAQRERERDGATSRIAVAGLSSNPHCFSHVQS